MGGQGSGGSNRLTDEEKRRRGTWRANTSDEVYDARAAAKVVTGPWLTTIPEPEYALNEIGRAKYDEWTKELFEQNKLTRISVTRASLAALLHQKFHAVAEAGKYPSANDVSKFQSAVRDLDIAANAKVTATPGGPRRFANAGFSNSRISQVRLRPASSGSGNT